MELWVGDPGAAYRETRERISALVSAGDELALATPLPTCPGWSVRDVLGHLLALVVDVGSGALTGPPSSEETAEQVARYADVPLGSLLTAWAERSQWWESAAPGPPAAAVIDVVSHEHDIRGALGRPGARESDAVRFASDLLLRMRTDVPVRIEVEDRAAVSGPQGNEPLVLATTRWELLRARMGRRSLEQIHAMNWSDDPAPILDRFLIFGPSSLPIIE